MATIIIKDLSESVDLDHQAMASITGGARIRTAKTIFARTMLQGTRIVNYPSGFSQKPLADIKTRYK
ncbi:MAG: hypothetical protein V4568_04180 [Pseudomonadota bacterium]